MPPTAHRRVVDTGDQEREESQPGSPKAQAAAAAAAAQATHQQRSVAQSTAAAAAQTSISCAPSSSHRSSPSRQLQRLDVEDSTRSRTDAKAIEGLVVRRSTDDSPHDKPAAPAGVGTALRIHAMHHSSSSSSGEPQQHHHVISISAQPQQLPRSPTSASGAAPIQALAPRAESVESKIKEDQVSTTSRTREKQQQQLGGATLGVKTNNSSNIKREDSPKDQKEQKSDNNSPRKKIVKGQAGGPPSGEEKKRLFATPNSNSNFRSNSILSIAKVNWSSSSAVTAVASPNNAQQQQKMSSRPSFRSWKRPLTSESSKSSLVSRADREKNQRRIKWTLIVSTLLNMVCFGVLGFLLFGSLGLTTDAYNVTVPLTRALETVRYNDEKLTMSARQAAWTGDQKWSTRYNDSLQPYFDASDLINRLAPALLEAFNNKNVAANVDLFSVEDKVTAMFQAGKPMPPAQQELLTSQRELDSTFYSDAKTKLNEAFEALAQDINQRTDNSAKEAKQFRTITIIVLVIFLIYSIPSTAVAIYIHFSQSKKMSVLTSTAAGVTLAQFKKVAQEHDDTLYDRLDAKQKAYQKYLNQNSYHPQAQDAYDVLNDVMTSAQTQLVELKTVCINDGAKDLLPRVAKMHLTLDTRITSTRLVHASQVQIQTIASEFLKASAQLVAKQASELRLICNSAICGHRAVARKHVYIRASLFAQSPQRALYMLLSNRCGDRGAAILSELQSFLSAGRNAENLLFLLAMVQFKTQTVKSRRALLAQQASKEDIDQSEKDIFARALVLYSTYIHSDAKLCVNLDHATKQELDLIFRLRHDEAAHALQQKQQQLKQLQQLAPLRASALAPPSSGALVHRSDSRSGMLPNKDSSRVSHNRAGRASISVSAVSAPIGASTTAMEHMNGADGNANAAAMPIDSALQDTGLQSVTDGGLSIAIPMHQFKETSGEFANTSGATTEGQMMMDNSGMKISSGSTTLRVAVFDRAATVIFRMLCSEPIPKFLQTPFAKSLNQDLLATESQVTSILAPLHKFRKQTDEFVQQWAMKAVQASDFELAQQIWSEHGASLFSAVTPFIRPPNAYVEQLSQLRSEFVKIAELQTQRNNDEARMHHAKCELNLEQLRASLVTQLFDTLDLIERQDYELMNDQTVAGSPNQFMSGSHVSHDSTKHSPHMNYSNNHATVVSPSPVAGASVNASPFPGVGATNLRRAIHVITTHPVGSIHQSPNNNAHSRRNSEFDLNQVQEMHHPSIVVAQGQFDSPLAASGGKGTAGGGAVDDSEDESQLLQFLLHASRSGSMANLVCAMSSAGRYSAAMSPIARYASSAAGQENSRNDTATTQGGPDNGSGGVARSHVRSPSISEPLDAQQLQLLAANQVPEWRDALPMRTSLSARNWSASALLLLELLTQVDKLLAQSALMRSELMNSLAQDQPWIQPQASVQPSHQSTGTTTGTNASALAASMQIMSAQAQQQHKMIRVASGL